MDQKILKEAYIKHTEARGMTPLWPYQFIDPLGLADGDFYDFYPSLLNLEQDIWKGFFEEVQERLDQEPAFQEYTAREQLLAYYFTLIEVLSQRKDFINILFGRLRLSVTPPFLKSFKQHYLRFVGDIINQARMEKEILDRPIMGNWYNQGLWGQCQFVLWFWVNDQSKDGELTDAAIERAVHLSFDLMGPTPIDSMIDFAKFLYQSR